MCEDSHRSKSRRADGTEVNQGCTAMTTASAIPDGGTVDDLVLDPWGSSTIDDYRSLFEEFGIESFDELLADIPDPHYLMRRGVIFGHREYQAVLDAMKAGEEFAALSGFMPTGDPHIGHKLVFDELIWHQQQGGDVYGLIADLEAHAARGMSWDEIDEYTESYLLSLLALGFDPEAGTLYRQSENEDVQNLAFELGSKARFSEFQGIYGFNGETSVSHMLSVVTQMADILYPQLDRPVPTVIPVGPDQDPHVRFARDLAARMRFFKVTEAYASFELEDAERKLVKEAYVAETAESDDPVRASEAAEWILEHMPASGARKTVCEKLDASAQEPLSPRVRFFDRNATFEAFEALIDEISGKKRVYEGHIDAFEMDVYAAKELARSIEVDYGGYGFILPSSIYHRFMTGLKGGKMSSSVPASHISLLDSPDDGYEKVKSAETGGRETAALQRELGGEPDKCPVYELYAYLLANDDDEYATRVYNECAGGERLCGDCKTEAAELMATFLESHQELREEAREQLNSIDVQLESTRKRR